MARVVSRVERGEAPADRSCQDKVRHTNALAARRHMGELIRRGNGRHRALTIYDCAHCGGLHVGHRTTPAVPALTDTGKLREDNPMSFTACPGPCEAGQRPPGRLLCRVCWFGLSRPARRALSRRGPGAISRLRELRAQLEAAVPLRDIQISP